MVFGMVAMMIMIIMVVVAMIMTLSAARAYMSPTRNRSLRQRTARRFLLLPLLLLLSL